MDAHIDERMNAFTTQRRLLCAVTSVYSQMFGTANSAGASRCTSTVMIGKDEWCVYKNDTNSEKNTQFGNMRRKKTKGMMHDAYYDDDPSGCTIHAFEMVCALEISSTHVSTAELGTPTIVNQTHAAQRSL